MNSNHAPTLTQQIIGLFSAALHQVAPEVHSPITLERPRQADHGEFACTLALQLAKLMHRPPRELAQALVQALPASPLIQRVELAGPGFINVFLTAPAKQGVIAAVLQAGSRWGEVDLGHQRRVQVEFVSSNPTGPLHVGHGRGAAFGASLANLLQKAGYEVQREYYVNDAGRQMDILALSTWLRYLHRFGSQIAFPPNGYQGDYVSRMAEQLQSQLGAALLHPDAAILSNVPMAALSGTDPVLEEAAIEAAMDGLIANAKALLGDDYRRIHQHVLTEQLADCRDDLEAFGVTFDEWFSQLSLFALGQVAVVGQRLEQAGQLNLQDGAGWFRSTTFGDEKDRVVQRENGLYTYFASDIAYHVNKLARGFDLIIDVWGADHHGYIPRVKAALMALGLEAKRMEVPLVQFVSLYRLGEKVQMSTRKGQFVTLRALREEVGRDAARFFYVLRKSDQHLDFDLDLATSRSNDNPVFYVQYAHARIRSVMTKWGGDTSTLSQCDLSPLEDSAEFSLMQLLRAYPETIESAARERAPHALAFYLKDLASVLHSYYNAVPFLVEDERVRLSRLALLQAVACVLQDGLGLLGVSAPDTM